MPRGGGSRPLQWAWRLTSAGLRVLPDLIIVGAQKAGTTSLFHYFAQHPQVARPFRKEVHYFDRNFGRTARWYKAHFPLRRELYGGQIAFEATPLYLFNPLVPGRIAELLPKAKLVAILRDPTDRAISHYFMERRKGREPLPIREALQQEQQRLAPLLASGSYDHRTFAHFSYKLRGHYAEQLQRFRSVFPPEQLLTLGSEELYARPEAVLRQLFDFAGIDSSFEVPNLRARNPGDNRIEVDQATRDELDDYFRPHNRRLYEMISRDFGWGR